MYKLVFILCIVYIAILSLPHERSLNNATADDVEKDSQLTIQEDDDRPSEEQLLINDTTNKFEQLTIQDDGYIFPRRQNNATEDDRKSKSDPTTTHPNHASPAGNAIDMDYKNTLIPGEPMDWETTLKKLKPVLLRTTSLHMSGAMHGSVKKCYNLDLRQIPVEQSLSLQDFVDIMTPQTWMWSHQIDYAMYLLLKQFPAMDGLQCAGVYQPSYQIPVYTPRGKFVQILNIRNNHWIVVSNIFSQDEGAVCVYDSALGNYGTTEFDQIRKIIRPLNDEITIIFPKVQQQSADGDNCGFFAIAYAVALCFEKRPEIIELDEKCIRQSISEMLRSGKWAMEFAQPSPITRIEVSICCKCKLPPDTRMINCTNCGNCFHLKCVSIKVPRTATDDLNEEWTCDACTKK